MDKRVIIEKVIEKDLDEFFKVFSGLIQSEMLEYSERTRKYFYTNNRAINKKVLKRKLGEGNIVLSATLKKKIVGILIADRPFGGISICHWLAVDRQFQMMGIGRSLLLGWEKISKDDGAHGLRLETDKRNIDFYKKMGFSLIGLDKRGEFGTDNYVMKKLIQTPKEENFLK